jgi:hypothetical protein
MHVASLSALAVALLGLATASPTSQDAAMLAARVRYHSL